MPPNQKPFQVESIEAPYAPPLPELLSGEPLSSSDDAFSSTSASSLEDHFEIPTSTSIYEPIEIPIEQNLRELLIKVTGTRNLETITEVKLRVISRDVSLQHLNIHTPLLRELTLDGSYVSSLRDLGCGLQNLKILRVNRCGLTSLDGTFGLESVEELYAADNLIESPVQCSYLPNIRIVDLRRNRLKSIVMLRYLDICPVLEHLYLEGNEEVDLYPKRRQTVKNLLPNLKTLDGEPFTEDECSKDFSNVDQEEVERYLQVTVDKKLEESFSKELAILAKLERQPASSPRPSTSASSASEYVVHFPPKSLSARPASAAGISTKNNGNILAEVAEVADKSKQVVPSVLTSGAPICGNVAAALRKRSHLQEAWADGKDDKEDN